MSSYDVVFDEDNYITLAYMSQTYAETMAMRPAVSYIPCATSSKGGIGNTITFAQFEEGGFII